MEAVLFFVALALYLAGTVGYLLFIGQRRPAIGALATATTAAGFAAHTLSHLLRLLEAGHPPLGTLTESLSFFAWATVLIYLITEWRYRNRIIGALVLPIVVLAASGAAALPSRIGSLAPTLQGVGLWVHVALAVLGNAAFALTFCAGLIYLLQERQLKSKHPGLISLRLPSLDLLDDVGVKSLIFGFPLLTLGLISGSIWAEVVRGSYFRLEARETWSVLSWLIYASLLYARLSAGWRGRKAAILSIVGFCLVLFTFVGVSLIRHAI